MGTVDVTVLGLVGGAPGPRHARDAVKLTDEDVHRIDAVDGRELFPDTRTSGVKTLVLALRKPLRSEVHASRRILYPCSLLATDADTNFAALYRKVWYRKPEEGVLSLDTLARRPSCRGENRAK